MSTSLNPRSAAIRTARRVYRTEPDKETAKTVVLFAQPDFYFKRGLARESVPHGSFELRSVVGMDILG